MSERHEVEGKEFVRARVCALLYSRRQRELKKERHGGRCLVLAWVSRYLQYSPVGILEISCSIEYLWPLNFARTIL
jgi:hypothetical protein